jgi:hypothetical protein
LFNIFVMLYMIVPIIVIPILAIMKGNWYLLFGILFSYGASFSATWAPLISPGSTKGRSSIIAMLLVGSTVRWLVSGFHFFDLTTFYFVCVFWGYLFFEIADNTQDEYALQMLTESPRLFDNAISAGVIRIIRRRDT